MPLTTGVVWEELAFSVALIVLPMPFLQFAFNMPPRMVGAAAVDYYESKTAFLAVGKIGVAKVKLVWWRNNYAAVTRAGGEAWLGLVQRGCGRRR